jgi:L-malate glycosyltransferase
MKIIYIIDKLVKAGTQNHLYQLAKSFHRSGYDIQIVSLEKNNDYVEKQFESANIKLIKFDSRAFYSPDSLKKIRILANFLRDEKPDIVETYLLKANLMGTLGAKMAGVPVILSTRRNMGYDNKLHHVILLNLLDWFTTATVVNSQAIADITRKQEKIPLKKIYRIYNGVDTDKFSESENDLSEQDFNLPADVPVIGIVANIREVKGYEYLFHAMARVLKNQRAHLLVVGNIYNGNDYFLKIKELASNLNISQNITFKDNCKNIPKILNSIDIAVLSSVSEGFSNTLLEYMAAKKAIVATRVGGNSEAIIHEKSGLLVPAKNEKALAAAIIRLLENKRMAEKLADHARKRVIEKFSLAVMFDNYQKLYQMFLEKSLIHACTRR